MSDSSKPEAFVSLATNDFYATGALTLGKSIRDTGSTRKLALVITSGVSEQMKEALSRIWDELILVDEMDSGDAESLAVLCRPELGVTFTKIAVWTLTQYSKCVYLDADTLVLENVDELFSRDELSAAPDIGWPDCFNSGVFVFCPSQETFRNLVGFAQQMGSFDGGDQGLLNLFWGDWASDDIKYHLPFIYNMTANSSYGYAPAYLRFKDNIKIIHFIGPVKPWQHTYLSDLDTVILMSGTFGSQHSNQDFIRRWWRVYSSLDVEPGILASITESQTGNEESRMEAARFSHRRDFESGFIDYHGRDSFENIFTHMKRQLGDEQSSEDSGSLKSASGSSLRSKGSSSWSKEESSEHVKDSRESQTQTQEELQSKSVGQAETQTVGGGREPSSVAQKGSGLSGGKDPVSPASSPLLQPKVRQSSSPTLDKKETASLDTVSTTGKRKPVAISERPPFKPGENPAATTKPTSPIVTKRSTAKAKSATTPTNK